MTQPAESPSPPKAARAERGTALQLAHLSSPARCNPPGCEPKAKRSVEACGGRDERPEASRCRRAVALGEAAVERRIALAAGLR